MFITTFEWKYDTKKEGAYSMNESQEL